jgi:hypothetical protein
LSIATVCQEEGEFKDINYDRAWGIKVVAAGQLQPMNVADGSERVFSSE